MANPEQVTSTKRIYKGRVLGLRIDTIKMADGTVSERAIVEHGESVCIVAIDENDVVVLVRQYRLAAGQQLLEIPAGSMEPNETPLEAAQRELREETGRVANKWEKLGGYYAAPPNSCTCFWLKSYLKDRMIKMRMKMLKLKHMR